MIFEGCEGSQNICSDVGNISLVWFTAVNVVDIRTHRDGN